VAAVKRGVTEVWQLAEYFKADEELVRLRLTLLEVARRTA